MKKKRRILIFSIIAILIIILLIILLKPKNTKNDVSKINKIYNDLLEKQEYIFTMKKNDNEKIVMAKKGEKTMIDQYLDNEHSSTLIKDGNTYLILHDRQEYYIYENNNIEQSILIDGIKDLLQKQYNCGEEKVFGKKYDFEEYVGSSAFILTNLRDANESDIKTRFYFDKNDNLNYIKTIYGENKEELLNINISYEVDDSIFEIPETYAESN